ncbi:Protein kinase STUNTED [Linum perenne]
MFSVTFRGWNSMARYCSKRLPPTTDVLAIHNGRIVFRRFNSSQLPSGLLLTDKRRSHEDLKPSLSLTSTPIAPSEFGDSELSSSVRSSFEVLTESGSGDSKDEIRKGRRSDSCLSRDQKPGWPLLRRATSADADTRELSVVQWALSLPNRRDSGLESLSEESIYGRIIEKIFPQLGEIGKRLEILLQEKKSSSCCKWLSYELLEAATCKFHSANLIGKGGWNQVYKGTLQDGKLVAVKIRKSSLPEAREEFVQELEIVSSLNHNSITPLVGICIKDSDLISVYHFLPKGSLEENLHGKNKAKAPLSWDSRFGIAVKIAESLNYLHNKASRPVIHRDVKSGNILLTDGLEPQLSDFGLAIWGPTTSSFVTQPDVVGTFGYLAPEYFMYGKVSDKIDVYSFGVVLLELITGREAIISSENSKMVVAAKLCTTRAARLRPKMSEVLKLLREETDLATCMIPQHKAQADADADAENEEDSYDDDEVYPESSPQLHLNLAFVDLDTDSTSHSSSSDQGSCLSWEDYLKGRWSRSSSFNH